MSLMSMAQTSASSPNSVAILGTPDSHGKQNSPWKSSCAQGRCSQAASQVHSDCM